MYPERQDKPPTCTYINFIAEEFAPYVYAIDAHYVEDTVSLTYHIGYDRRPLGKAHLVNQRWSYSINVDAQVGVYVSKETLLSYLKEKIK